MDYFGQSLDAAHPNKKREPKPALYSPELPQSVEKQWVLLLSCKLVPDVVIYCGLYDSDNIIT